MNGQQNFKQLHRNIFIIPVILITIAFLGLIKDFLLASFWAAVLSIIFFKLYGFLENRWKKPNLAAILTLCIIILVVVIPVSLITVAVVDQSQELISEYNESGFKADSLIQKLEDQIPALEKLANRLGIELDDVEQQVRSAFMTASKTFATRAVQFTKNSLRLLLAYSIMLYLLFFFLRDGRMIVNEIVKSLPFGNDRERHLMELFASTSRATMKGTVIVACLQGTLGGLLFWFVGIKSPVLWGVIMGFLSFLPVGGSGIIWLPAALIMLGTGEITKGVVIILVGALLIGLVDNLLRPILVGNDTKLPDYLILLSTLGGLAWFGISGFIIGPVIASLFISSWKILRDDFGGDV